MFTRKQFVSASVGALVAGTLGACSSNGSNGGSAATKASDDSYTLVQSGKILGASDLQYPPLSQMNESTGQP